MSNIVNLPTYDQVETVKTIVNTTENKVDEVKLETTEILNTLENVELGTNWSKYTPIFKRFQANLTTNNRQIVVYEFLGEGYIDKVTLYPNTSGEVNLELYIDNVLTSTLKINSTNGVSALTIPTYLFNNTSQFYIPTTNGIKNVTLPADNSTLQAPGLNISFILSNPIFFKSSIQLKAILPLSQNTDNLAIGQVTGGLVL